MILKINPEGAKLLAIRAKFLFLKTKLPIDNKAKFVNIPSDIQAAGT
jgi:hypothetical protein